MLTNDNNNNSNNNNKNKKLLYIKKKLKVAIYCLLNYLFVEEKALEVCVYKC